MTLFSLAGKLSVLTQKKVWFPSWLVGGSLSPAGSAFCRALRGLLKLAALQKQILTRAS